MCHDFDGDPELFRYCASAAKLNCLLWGDTFSTALHQRPMGAPRCELPRPPMGAFWGAVHDDLYSRSGSSSATIPVELLGDNADLGGCGRVLRECYARER